jgi:hypothetical protein
MASAGTNAFLVHRLQAQLHRVSWLIDGAVACNGDIHLLGVLAIDEPFGHGAEGDFLLEPNRIEHGDAIDAAYARVGPKSDANGLIGAGADELVVEHTPAAIRADQQDAPILDAHQVDADFVLDHAYRDGHDDALLLGFRQRQGPLDADGRIDDQSITFLGVGGEDESA